MSDFISCVWSEVFLTGDSESTIAAASSLYAAFSVSLYDPPPPVTLDAPVFNPV